MLLSKPIMIMLLSLLQVGIPPFPIIPLHQVLNKHQLLYMSRTISLSIYVDPRAVPERAEFSRLVEIREHKTPVPDKMAVKHGECVSLYAKVTPKCSQPLKYEWLIMKRGMCVVSVCVCTAILIGLVRVAYLEGEKN